MIKRATTSVLLVLAAAAPAKSHDYWLQPQQFYLAKGEATAVQLFVGDQFAKQAERTFQAKKTPSLQLISQDASRDLKTITTDGSKPVAKIALERAGNHLIAMERDWSHIELEAKKFNNYLKHEGLSSIVEQRRQAGEQDSPGRERYRRYLKALVQVGGESDATFSRTIGHRLEILPQTNPCSCKPGDTLTVSVLFEDKPLRGAQVVAYNRQLDATKLLETRTDDKGRAKFALDRSGVWLIRLVHMQRCQNVRGADWESFWSAYTFQLK